jgi:hypothetical protein
MVKLQIGASTFFCETAEEAYRIHRMDAGASPTVTTGGVPARASQNGNGGLGHKFLKKLEPLVGQHLSSEKFMEVVNAKSTYALGPVLRRIRESLESEGLAFENYVSKEKPDADTPTSWVILKSEHHAA